MRKIKIAQIGTSRNSHGNCIIRSLRCQSDLFELVGYTMPENEKEKFPDFMADFEGLWEMTLDEILNDPEIEAVAVETEEIYLTKYAQLAADHGKHMHMEKPGGTDPVAFEKLIETVKKNGTVFHTGYMYRYNPYVADLLERIDRGELGEILSVEAQMNCAHNPTVRQWLENFPGGMMFFLGCHLIDLIFRICGEPEQVIPLHRCSGLDGVTAMDSSMTVFTYPKGVSFAKTTAVERGGFARRQLVVTGTKGTVELKPLEWYDEGVDMLWTGRTVHTETVWTQDDPYEKSKVFHRYDPMMASFAAMVRGEKQNAYTPDYELALYRLVQQACGR